jgi:putative membrane-bound dehydrogenase-like protein
MLMSKKNVLSVVILLVLTLQIQAESPEVKSPLSPGESLKYFQLDPLLSIEVVAAEPEVVDPVAIRFDENGRLWVAEMRDYPLGPIKKMDGQRTEKDAEPLSRIKILEDKDGDGRFESATVFADKLLFVTGLQPWKGGVIVTLSGKVAYMKDTDGDGKADVNETWFTGFSESNSQLRANHPTFALDNHIYIANGLRGGMVVNHLKKLRGQRGEARGQDEKSGVGFQPAQKDESEEKPINISGMDFRFDPLTGEAEAVSGNGQFGLCFDDWGNRFVCSNRNPCQHVVIENRYLKKAPTVAIPSVVQDVAAFAENSRIYPISKFWTTSNLHEGQFTAACGVFIYRGDMLPEAFRGNVFTCDPTGNLIHREIMEAKGASFTSKPAYEGKEFLASPDTWFRPVSMEHGPDGALYIVDMYRAVIEHPEWVPDELKNRPDERLGDDRGRIYRIVPKDYQRFPVLKLVPRLATKDVVPCLGSNNSFQRDTAQRLLVERNEERSRAEIAQLLENTPSGTTAIHCLWLLTHFGGASEAQLNAAITHPDAQVRRHCVLVTETDAMDLEKAKRYAKGLHGHPDEAGQLLFLLHPSEIPVPDGKTTRVGNLALSHADDPWIRRAALLGSSERITTELAGILRSARSDTQRLLVREWAEYAGGTQPEAECRKLVADLAGESSVSLESKLARLHRILLDSLATGLQRRKLTLAAIATGPNNDKQMREFLTQAREGSEQLASDATQSVELRAEALSVIRHFEKSLKVLESLALSEADQDLRLKAIAALQSMQTEEAWQKLVAKFSSESPVIRQAILEGVLQHPERIALLLDSLESGSLKPTELDPVQTGRLLKHGDTKIRERAEKIFGSATPEDRKKALADYQSVLAMTGDAKRGQVSFAKNCATCHKIGETGVNVAPDISDSRTKTPAQILADIIQPNRAIDANYLAYNLLLADGTTASGILTSETSTSITLKAAGAKVITVARGEIEQLKSTGVSLMPDGLEKTIPPREMADVIAFIKNWRYLDGRVPVK